MSASERTKLLLANGLRDLTATTPFRKIRVGELCQRCGVDRRTFYYHFRDVYDLAAWTFDQTMDAFMPDANGQLRRENLIRMLGEFLKDQNFYRKALEENSQNAPGRHIMDRIVMMYQKVLRERKGGEDLSDREYFCLYYHSVGCLTMLRRWILNDRRVGPEEITERLCLAMPPMLRALYDENEKGGSKNEE